MKLLRALVDNYEVAQGFVSAFPSLTHAAAETELAVIQGDLDEPRARAWHDYRATDFFATKLRRLYPVTFIGNAIWDRLPPMPEVSPAPEVRDLGSCKMLIAWPELVSPYDPAFLAGTRELRQWLWPHTIQNPYDRLDLDV